MAAARSKTFRAGGTVLLLVTCGWIVHEAVNRLFDAPKSPRHGGAIIILISLLVDVNGPPCSAV
ncbi:MAG: hypothetical protein ACLRWP_17070 [Bilophila wadsworthia]